MDPKVRAKEKDLNILEASYLKVRDNLTTTYNILEARLKDKPYFVNFRNVLCSRTIPVYETDGVHLKPPGNKMVATSLAEMLKARGWLEKGEKNLKNL